MTFGQTPENVLYLFLLCFAVLPLLYVVALVGRLLQWVLRIQSDLFVPLFIVLILAGGVVGISFYLDWYGAIVPGRVAAKDEAVKYRAEGDWEHQFTLRVEYALPGQSTATATLNPPVTIFDTVRQGETIPLRVLNLGDWPSLVRPASQSTLTWLPWRWIGGVLALILVGVVLWKLSDTRVGCLPGILFVCVLAALPLANKWWEWRQSLDPSLTPLRVSTQVEAVQHVAWLDPLPAENSRGNEWDTGFDVPEPYDIVLVRYQPQGYLDKVLGVDAIDSGRPDVQPGMPVVVQYSLDNPRQVRLLDARRLHYWLNPLGWVQHEIIGLALSLGVTVALAWIGQRFKAWLRQLLARADRLRAQRGNREKLLAVLAKAPAIKPEEVDQL